jgi:hypothetical protein
MSEEKIITKDYSGISTRVLNRSIRKREEQITRFEKGDRTTSKTLDQLKYELEQMLNALMERSITKISEPNTSHEENKERS